MPYNNYFKYIKDKKICFVKNIKIIKVPCYYIICLGDNLKSYQLYIFEVNTNQCYELIKKNGLSFCHLYV
jgi:hypothetical protein